MCIMWEGNGKPFPLLVQHQPNENPGRQTLGMRDPSFGMGALWKSRFRGSSGRQVSVEEAHVVLPNADFP